MSESVNDGSNDPIVLRLAGVGRNDGDKRCHKILLKLMGAMSGLIAISKIWVVTSIGNS